MKKIYYITICLLAFYTISSLNVQEKQTTRLFEKTCFVEIDSQKDSVLFKPYSNAWKQSWSYGDSVLTSNRSMLMSLSYYQAAFANRNDNLWTLLHPKIIHGALTVFSSYDPYAFQVRDEGQLRFPIKGTNPNDNFITSPDLRDYLSYYLGRLGPQSDFPMSNIYGSDSTIINPDGTESFVYPAADYLWFSDYEIIKYKVRVSMWVDKNGKLKKYSIKSIAPVVPNAVEGRGDGEHELFWLDYSQVKPFLNEGYFFDSHGKPVTYLSYIEKQVSLVMK